jgi:penicillin amidase
MQRSRLGRRLLMLGAAIVVVVVTAALALLLILRASLPELDGGKRIEALDEPVRIHRDGLGVPTIRAASRTDAAVATGLVHAQDRFFQMDLMRRQAAGELAELFGPAAVEVDQRLRRHRLRHRSEQIYSRLSATEKSLLEAYAAGVNDGLRSLGAWPPEYLMLRTSPAPWVAEDTLLVVYSMYLNLQDPSARLESLRGVMRDTLPQPLYEFLTPAGTSWDAPVDGSQLRTAPIPGPETVDITVGAPEAEAESTPLRETPDAIPGSNSWAMAGARTGDGRAIVANDMHLGMAVPGVWYRAEILWTDPAGEPHRLVGATLPGAPFLVVGSNTHIAWGFTNSQGDWSDLVVLEPGSTPGTYRAPDGDREIKVARETIAVRGGDDVIVEVPETIWGPIVDTDHRGRQRAACWVGYRVDAGNLATHRLEAATTVDEAVEIANRAWMPHQNIVIADRDGRIAWTLTGRIPRRVGFDGSIPVSRADGQRRWDGWLEPAEYPRVIDPPEGRLWTANARVVGEPWLQIIGDGGYATGARAAQIRDGLRALGTAAERDMLAIQLDHRALFLERWRDLVVDSLGDETLEGHPQRQQVRELVTGWNGRASIDAVGYRIVRGVRQVLSSRIGEWLTAPCRAADPSFHYGRLPSTERVVWTLLEERPGHLLSPEHESWHDAVLAAIDTTVELLTQDGRPLTAATWGQLNTLRARHALSQAVPFLGPWLDMRPVQLPGGGYMPRVQSPTWGASERMAVAPGHEADAYFHMPCGQSGHPLSPHYRDSHPAWIHGEPTPLLPGPPEHTLTLMPE